MTEGREFGMQAEGVLFRGCPVPSGGSRDSSQSIIGFSPRPRRRHGWHSRIQEECTSEDVHRRNRRCNLQEKSVADSRLIPIPNSPLGNGSRSL